MKFLYIIILATFMAACGEENPLQGEPESLTNAEPPAEREKPRFGVPSDSLRIFTEPEVINFVEGEEGQFKIIGKVLKAEEGKDYDLKILNMPDGASFDPSTKIFTWKPSNGAVLGDELVTQYLLVVDMFSKGRKELTRRKNIPVWVHIARGEGPEIVEIINNKKEYKEGDIARVKITVRDKTSFDFRNKSGVAPKLQLYPLYSGARNALAYLVNFPKAGVGLQDKKNPELWSFEYSFRFNSDITRKRSNIGFALMVIDRYGSSSKVQKVKFPILNKVIRPRISWDPYFEPVFTEGVEKEFVFSIFDPRSEGQVESINFENKCEASLGEVASCKCEESTNDRSLICSVKWAAPVGSKKKNRISFKVKNKLEPNDVKDMSVTRYIKVKKALLPGPSPESVSQGGSL